MISKILFSIGLLFCLSQGDAVAGLRFHEKGLSTLSDNEDIFKEVNYLPGKLEIEKYRNQTKQKLMFKFYADSNHAVAQGFLDDYIHMAEFKKDARVLLMMQLPTMSGKDIYTAKYEHFFENPNVKIVTFSDLPELYQKLSLIDQEAMKDGARFDLVEMSFHGLPGAHEPELKTMFFPASKDIRKNLPELKNLTNPNAKVVISSCSFGRDSFLVPSNSKVALAELGSRILPQGGKIYASEKIVMGGFAEYWPWLRDRDLAMDKKLWKELTSFLGWRLNWGIEQTSLSFLYGPNPHLINYDLIEIEIPAGAETYKDCTLNLVKSVFIGK